VHEAEVHVGNPQETAIGQHVRESFEPKPKPEAADTGSTGRRQRRDEKNGGQHSIAGAPEGAGDVLAESRRGTWPLK
jgi:hypothetical protein